MLTIDKSTELTVYDFIKNKEHKPFKDWRTVAKTENFGLLFRGVEKVEAPEYAT